MLLHGEGEVRAAFHRCVVRDEHALLAFDDADPRHDAGARRLAAVQLPGGERAQLQEGCVGIDQAVDPLAGRELAALAVPGNRLLAAAAGDERGPLAQLGDELLHPLAPPLEDLVALRLGAEYGHVRTLPPGFGLGPHAAPAAPTSFQTVRVAHGGRSMPPVPRLDFGNSSPTHRRLVSRARQSGM